MSFKVGDQVLRLRKGYYSSDFIKGTTYTVKEIVGGNIRIIGMGSRLYDPDFFELAKSVYPNPPHKYAELIKAWADGAEIEIYYEGAKKWGSTKHPGWCEGYKYRIKPQKSEKDIKIEEIETKMRKLADELKELKGG